MSVITWEAEKGISEESTWCLSWWMENLLCVHALLFVWLRCIGEGSYHLLYWSQVFGYFSLPCRLFLSFLPVVSSVELIEGSVISLCVVSRTCYTGAEFPSQVHSSCQNPW